MPRFHRRSLAAVLAGLAVGAGAGGCNLIAGVASKLPKPDVGPSYKGLAGQSVGVMVWAEQGTRIDWPSVQLDIANGIDQKLKQAQAAKIEELQLTTFPTEPRSIVRFQREHPIYDTVPVVEVAPKLKVSRLIYVELKSFATRSEEAITLFRGDATASVRLVEIGPDNKAQVVYEESDVHVTFPKTAPQEGVLNANDQKIYNGTLDELTSEVVKRFITHPDES